MTHCVRTKLATISFNIAPDVACKCSIVNVESPVKPRRQSIVNEELSGNLFDPVRAINYRAERD